MKYNFESLDYGPVMTPNMVNELGPFQMLPL